MTRTKIYQYLEDTLCDTVDPPCRMSHTNDQHNNICVMSTCMYFKQPTSVFYSVNYLNENLSYGNTHSCCTCEACFSSLSILYMHVVEGCSLKQPCLNGYMHDLLEDDMT